MDPRNRFQGMNSASLCSLAVRYNNPIPPRFMAPIDCLKIPAQATWTGGIGFLESIPGRHKSLKIRPQVDWMWNGGKPCSISRVNASIMFLNDFHYRQMRSSYKK
jgi:hypothetical protein